MKERLQDLAVKVSLPDDTYLQQDNEILEIFVEELQEIFTELNQLFPLWLSDFQNENYLKEIRRHFHTLKGSGRMVGANHAGELAWYVEDLLNRVITKTVELTPTVQQFTLACKNLFEFKLYPIFEQHAQFSIDVRPLIVLGQELLQQQSCSPILLDLLAELAHLDRNTETALDMHVLAQETSFDDILNTEIIVPVSVESNVVPAINASEQSTPNDAKVLDNDLSAETLNIYVEEGLEHLDAINHFLQQPEHSPKQTDALIRALHTLKGSSGMAHIDPLFQASANVEQTLKVHLQENKTLTDSETQLLSEFSDYVTKYLGGLKQSNISQMTQATDIFTRVWMDYHQDQGHLEIEKISGTVSEILALQIDALLDTEYDFEQKLRQHDGQYLKQLLDDVHLLIQHTQQTATLALHTLAEKLQQSYQGLYEHAQLFEDAYTYELFDQAHQQLIDCFDTLATGQTVHLSDKTQVLLDELVDWTHPIATPVQNVAVSHVEDQAVPSATLTPIQACQLALVQDLQLFDQKQGVVLEDRELTDIFLDEAEDLIAELEQAFAEYQQNPKQHQVLQRLMRYLHTLKGGANMIVAQHIGEIAHTLESVYEKLIHEQLQPTETLYQVLTLVQDNIINRLDVIRKHQQDYPAVHTLAVLKEVASLSAPVISNDHVEPQIEVASSVICDVENIVQPPVEVSVVQQHLEETALDVPVSYIQRILSDQLLTESEQINHLQDMELISIFIDEADELLAQVEHEFVAYQDTHHVEALKVLMRYLHTLKGGANMLQASYIGQIAHGLESIYEKLIHKQLQPTSDLLEVLRCVQDQLAERLEFVKNRAVDYPATETLHVLTELQVSAQETVSTPVELAPDLTENLVASKPVIETTHGTEAKSDDSIEHLIYEQFVEEVQVLLQKIRIQLEQWFNNRGNRSLLLQLQRDAHTVKGAARMAKQEAIAAVADKFDDTFEQFAVRKFTSNAYDALLLRVLDWLEQAVKTTVSSDSALIIEQLKAIDFADATSRIELVIDENLPALNTYATVQGDGTEPPSMLGEWEDEDTTDQTPEMIRISAGLVEKMIDLAGENAINRSRIEMDMSQFSTTLNEMELAIQRLSDQLRRMEGELETQIIAKHGDEQSRYADFDPLEMDQYSSLNQLSKSLAESASDLVDFKVTLAEKVRDAESLLLQQSRIQSEMQDGLMRVRLVPFSRVATRLQRLIRQISSTLNRPVHFEMINRDLELDRSILERLVTPLEHMLRNAIDHGIETPEERRQVNKPDAGLVEITISRQGTDVVLDIRDDGKGIDPRKIEQKAQQLGLIPEQHQLSDQEILQYIFHSGLTTAKAVTQISGRGVGLDVVQNEIKSLGGHVTIHSELGQGTRFSIRVPTTVSVSDALMVKVLDQQYAIPLAQIERIVRVSPAALNDYFISGSEHFSLDGQLYKLRYAAEFIGSSTAQPRFNAGYSLPVLLIKGHNNQTVALLVDQLIGSRAQIVVKPLGKQLARIDVIGGATILGDGQVCLILDTVNLARRIQTASRHLQQVKVETNKVQRARQCVMIVDDSVTVRKVTSRLLERHGYDVVTAKDGVDAVEQIEHVKPDVMLLDIEMPRMDGFEVTNILRHHAVYHDLPIIMITSRTGEKHRERAFSLGVTHYMGKPFQESDLLARIEQVLTKHEV
ncbi:Hpt domain-containing protein [Acinetobacter sp.]|uniref:Hpt domain-containing protein n=1 Tax=Acinetobacter sp. TaxID=472 RepID=UPI0031E3AF40